MRATATLLALAAALLASPSLACSVRIGAVNTSTITYDPFVAAGAEGTVRVDVDLAEGDSCDAAIVLTDDNAVPLRSLGFGPGAAVAFRPQLRRDAGVREGTDPAEALVALTTANPHAEIAWKLLSDSDGILAPGDYTLPIRVQLRTPAQSLAPSIGAVALRSVARAQINLAGTVGSYESGSDTAAIDLGDLRNGSSGRAFLQLRANTQAHLTFVSEHRGFLVNGSSDSRIAYRVSFDGVDVALNQPASRSVDPPATLRGSSFELAVRVDDVTGAAAGRYSDTIVIEVSP